MNQHDLDEVRVLQDGIARRVDSLTDTATCLTGLASTLSGMFPACPITSFDQLKDALVVTDTTGGILRASLSAKRMSPLMVEGTNLAKHLPKPLQATDDPVEFAVPLPDNTNRYFDYTVSSVVEFGQPLYYINFRDVTVQRIVDKQNAVCSRIYRAIADESNRLMCASDVRLNLKQHLRQTVDSITRASNAEYCMVLKNDMSSNDTVAVVYTVASGLNQPITVSPTVTLDTEFPGATGGLARGTPAVLFAQNLPAATAARAAEWGARTFVFIPVYVDDLWWGQMLFMYEESFDDAWFYSERDALMTLATLMGSTLQRARDQQTNENSLLFQQALFDVVPLPMFARTLDGVYYYVNDAYADLVGLSRDEVVGRHRDEVLGATYAGQPTDFEESSVITRSTVVVTNHRTGVAQSGTVVRTVLYGHDGAPHGVLGVFQDTTQPDCTTECSSSRSATSFLTALLDHANDLIVFKNKRGELVFANEPFRKVVGQTSDYLNGKTNAELSDLFSPSFLLELNQHEFMAASTRQVAVYETLLNGLTYRVSVKPVLNRSGELSGTLLQAQAIAELSDTPYKELMDGMALPVVTVQPDGTIMYANREAVERFHLTARTSNLLDLVPAKQRSYVRGFLHAERGIVVRATLAVGNDHLPTELWASFLNGRVSVVVYDRSRANAEFTDVIAALNMVKEAVMVVGKTGSILFRNQRAQQVFALNQKDETLTTLGVGARDRETIMALATSTEQTMSLSLLRNHRSDDGTQSSWSMNISATVQRGESSGSRVIVFHV